MAQFRSLPREESPLHHKLQDSSSSRSSTLQEIGSQAVWSLSSAKPGFGIEQLRDNNLETYWQSDGSQPHYINIQFHKKVSIEEIEFYSNFKMDESYTPSKISVRSGTTFNDLREIKTIEVEEPTGWVSVPLFANELTYEKLRTNFIQIAIITNHQNGRDSHIRQIRIYGPRPNMSFMFEGSDFISNDFAMYTSLR